MNCLGKKFKKIDELFKAGFNKQLESVDLTFAQMNVLVYLENSGNARVTQKELASALEIKHSTMAGILKRMQEKGLVDVVIAPENKKYKNIYRTQKAKEIKNEIDKHRKKNAKTVVKGFSKEEIELLDTLLDKVLQNLKEDSAND